MNKANLGFMLYQTHALECLEVIGLADGVKACCLKTKVHWCSPRITLKVG